MKSIKDAIEKQEPLDGYVKKIDDAYLQAREALEEVMSSKPDNNLIFDYLQQACSDLKTILEGETKTIMPF